MVNPASMSLARQFPNSATFSSVKFSASKAQLAALRGDISALVSEAGAGA